MTAASRYKRVLHAWAILELLAAPFTVLSGMFFWSNHERYEAEQSRARGLLPKLHPWTGAVCRDGWLSPSTGQGTCSHHGGVSLWANEVRSLVEHSWWDLNRSSVIILSIVLVGGPMWLAVSLSNAAVKPDQPAKAGPHPTQVVHTRSSPPPEATSLRSTVIASAAYEHRAKQLTLWFHSGSIYTYADVPAAVFDGLLAADSPGSYAAKTIYRTFKTTRIA